MDAVRPYRVDRSPMRSAALLPSFVLMLALLVGVAAPAPANSSIDDLIGEVQAAVDSGDLSAGLGNSLIAKLTAAGRSLDRELGSATCGQLGAFINHVKALDKTGKLELNLAQSLIGGVNAVGSPIECALFDGTIVLGAALSETGRFALEGTDVRRGYELWREWVNNEYGGINIGGNRYQVEIVYYDDAGDAGLAADLVEKLITEDRVDFLLGPYSSGLTMPTSAVAEEYGVIMVEGNGAVEAIFERGFRN